MFTDLGKFPLQRIFVNTKWHDEVFFVVNFDVIQGNVGLLSEITNLKIETELLESGLFLGTNL